MKDYLAELVRETADLMRGRNLVREYLQARILGALQRAGAMVPLAFHGGTALRFLYAMPRYSEDLDFALERPGRSYDFRAYLRGVQGEFEAEGYRVAVKVNERHVVHSAFVRFAGLLFELGLSGQRDEVIAVKIEVDTNPPAGAGLETTVLRRYVVLQVQHHDKASLLAGKLHAVLQRPYLKGRDVYDLLWYLSDPTWPAPNYDMLNNALAQTGWQGPEVDPANWRTVVRRRLETQAWERVTADVRPFLQNAHEAELLTWPTIERLFDDPNHMSS